MEKSFLDIVKNRRTYYKLGKITGLSEEEIMELVRSAVKFTPSAFNSQSGRVAVLFGAEHDKLWDITKEILQTIVPAANFAETAAKLAMFRDAAGTILFFEDQDTVQELQQANPLYSDNFPLWSLQSSGMLQFIVWTALEERGLGANLQHYNPLIDEKIRGTWNIPESWRLISQMPFGNILEPTYEKTFLPVEPRVKEYR